MSDQVDEDNDRRPLIPSEYDGNDLDDDVRDSSIGEHDRRVEVLATALERYVGLMGVRHECSDETGVVLPDWQDPSEDLRKVIRVAARDLADSLTDLEDRFDMGFDPEPGDPLPPTFISFLWLRSLSYSVLTRAGYVDMLVCLPDGRFVHRQFPPEWPSLEDILERTAVNSDGERIIQPSTVDLSEKEILATPDELRAMRSCLSLLRLNSAKSVGLPTAPDYDTPRVRPENVPLRTISGIVSPPLESARKASYLGLIVNDKNQEIRRDYFSEFVDLRNKRLLWAVFLRLLQSRETDCTFDQLMSVWKTSGREETPSKSSVYVAISDLKKMIKLLNVTISNNQSIGYKLIDFPSSDGLSTGPGLNSA